MESVDPSEWLSAADCASRTGLTPRALRVYEEFGLICDATSERTVDRQHLRLHHC
jgi:DNA-binding transcriptional MerR regulator